MNKSAKRLWIPIVLLIVGIFMTSFAVLPIKDLLTNTFWVTRSDEDSGNIIINGETSSLSVDVASDLKELKLDLALADKINITFTDTPGVKIEGAKKGIEAIRTNNSNRELKLETSCKFPTTCNNDYALSSVDVQLPRSFAGEIKINSLSSSITVTGDSQTLQDIDINSLDANVTVEGISSDLSIDGADITFKGTNISGELDLDGLNMNATLTDISKPMKIEMDGMDASLAFTNLDDNLGYTVKMDGLDSTFKDNRTNDSRNASFGSLKINNEKPGGSFEIKMNGLNQSLIID